MALKEKTLADHAKRLTRALIYIQDNLHRPVQLKALSEVANLSPFHFHRIFKIHVGESLNQYVKRLRLERAAFRLRFTDEEITAIALSSGYFNTSAFCRAFKQRFQMSPSQYRECGRLKQKVGRYESFSNCGLEERCEIRMLPSQELLFVRRVGRLDLAAKSAWRELLDVAYDYDLVDQNTKRIGLTYDYLKITPDNKIRYDACISVNHLSAVPMGLGMQRLRAGMFAVFKYRGSSRLLDRAYENIYYRWLPASPYKLRNDPAFCLYPGNPSWDTSQPFVAEILVPVSGQ